MISLNKIETAVQWFFMLHTVLAGFSDQSYFNVNHEIDTNMVLFLYLYKFINPVLAFGHHQKIIVSWLFTFQDATCKLEL